jgi:hypothetical protein
MFSHTGRKASCRQPNGHDSLVPSVFCSESFLYRVIIKSAAGTHCRYLVLLQLAKNVKVQYAAGRLISAAKLQVRLEGGSENNAKAKIARERLHNYISYSGSVFGSPDETLEKGGNLVVGSIFYNKTGL